MHVTRYVVGFLVAGPIGAPAPAFAATEAVVVTADGASGSVHAHDRPAGRAEVGTRHLPDPPAGHVDLRADDIGAVQRGERHAAVHSLSHAADGTVATLSLTYHLNCNDGSDVYGDVRFHTGNPWRGVTLSPVTVPKTKVGTVSHGRRDAGGTRTAARDRPV